MITRDPRNKIAEIVDLGNPRKSHPSKICIETEVSQLEVIMLKIMTALLEYNRVVI